MSELSINLGSIQMPLSAATKTFAILAKRGAGKSYTAAVLAEEFHRTGIPFVVFDPIDVWWGLRLAADGVSPGLPVAVFGLDHADVPLTGDMGVQIAQAIVGHNVSCVLSTFGMPKAQQRKLITDFSATLLHINNAPRHIIIEEAHEFVPQRVMGDMAACFNAVNSLIVMGRNRGLGATLLSQRAATINKDSLTQIDTLLAFRNTSPQDRKALREWVEYHAAEGDFAAFMDSLPSLPTGEGWIWSPEFLNVFERIKIRKRTTFHPDRETLGAGVAMPTLAQADVQQFIHQFAKVIEPLSELRQLRQNIDAAAAPSPETKVAMGPARPEPVAVWEDERKKLIATYDAKLLTKDAEIAALHAKLAAIGELLNAVDLPAVAPSTGPASVPVSNGADSPGALVEPPERRQTGQVNQKIVDLWAKKLGGSKNGASRILCYLAEMYPMTFTRSQLALAVGMTASGGQYGGYLSTLLRNKMIVNEGGYLVLSEDLILNGNL